MRWAAQLLGSPALRPSVWRVSEGSQVPFLRLWSSLAEWIRIQQLGVSGVSAEICSRVTRSRRACPDWSRAHQERRAQRSFPPTSSHRPTGPPHHHRNDVDVFDYHFEERTVRACSCCMRILTAPRRSNAPSIVPSRPRLALQPSADRLLCALRPCLPVRSFRHLIQLGRRRHRHKRRPRLGTA